MFNQELYETAKQEVMSSACCEDDRYATAYCFYCRVEVSPVKSEVGFVNPSTFLVEYVCPHCFSVLYSSQSYEEEVEELGSSHEQF